MSKDYNKDVGASEEVKDNLIDFYLKIIDILDKEEEPKKYYLKHRYLREEETNYLGLNVYDSRLDVAYPIEGEFRKTKFTEEDIKKIEATGFDLRNFERVEVEDE